MFIKKFFQSTYARPQLRKEAIPTLLLGRPEKPKTQRRTLCRKRKAGEEAKKEETISMKRKRKKVEDEKENSYIELSHDNFPNHASHHSDKEKDVFDEIFDNDQIISIPISWGRTNFYWGENNTPAIHFHKLVGRKGKTGHVETFYQKEITINKNMTFLIKVNGVQVDQKAFEIENDHLNSAANLVDVINIIDKREICEGCPDITRTSVNCPLLKSFTYVDKSDIIRHNDCLLLLPTDNNKNSNSCKSCKSAKSFLVHINICKNNLNHKRTYS